MRRSQSNNQVIAVACRRDVDLNNFHPLKPEENNNGIREKLTLKKNVPLILTVRRLEERMGLDNLILAVEILLKKNHAKNFQLAIVGKGSLKQKLEYLIALSWI